MGKQKRPRHTGNLYRYRSAKPDDRKRVYRTRTSGRIRTDPHECETVRPDTGKIPESRPLCTAAGLYTGYEQVWVLYEQTPVLCGQERGNYRMDYSGSHYRGSYQCCLTCRSNQQFRTIFRILRCGSCCRSIGAIGRRSCRRSRIHRGSHWRYGRETHSWEEEILPMQW